MSAEEQAAHEHALMEALTNISGHFHMINGWVDSLWPYKQILHKHDPRILPQLVKARGEGLLSIKAMSKNLIRDDTKAIDLMYESIGKSVSHVAKLPVEERNKMVIRIAEVINESIK